MLWKSQAKTHLAHRTKTRIAWLTLASWVILIVIAFTLASEIDAVQSDDRTDFLPSGADSTRVAEISDSIEDRDAGQVFIVYHRKSGLEADDLTTIADHQQIFLGESADQHQVIRSDDGTTAFFTVRQPAVPEGADPEDAAAEFVTGIREMVNVPDAGLTVEVTGPTAIDVDIDNVFDGINTTLLQATALVVAGLLILIYRSPFLWLIPLASVGVASIVATGLVYLVASTADLQISTPSMTIMIVLVFGAGTDYALLLTSRYREFLRVEENRYAAMWQTLRTTAPAVIASGLTSSLGLLCLLTAQMNHLRGLGLVGAIGIVAALITMLTLFPALLVVVGRGAFWPFMPRVGVTPVAERRLWSWLANLGTRMSGRLITGTVLVLGVLALGALTLPGDLADLDSFTTPAESVQGYETLSAAFPDLEGRPVVVATAPENADSVINLMSEIARFGESEIDSRSEAWVLIESSVEAMPDSEAETELILNLRERIAREAGVDALVGGAAAERIDTARAVRRDMMIAIPLVLVAVFAILTILLRAVVAPLVVVLSVVLSFGAAVGISSLVFQHVFGFSGADPDLPVIGFVFLAALGVDYAIFLVTRIRDNAQQAEIPPATRAALISTGPVIVSAGIILAATFGVLMTLPYVPMVQIGFLVATGVLIESIVLPAMLIAPAAIRLRSRIWWPRRMSTEERGAV